MKKLLVLIGLFSTTVIYSQMLEAKDVVLEFNLGYPNIRPIVDDPSGISHTIFDFGGSKPKSIGQFILKGEFFMADAFGIIASMNYGYFHTYDEAEQEIYDGNTGQWTTNTYYYETKIHKWRFAAGINFHLIRTERLDTYFGLLGGSKKAFGSYESNDPNAQGNIKIYMLPFAVRAQYGIRYFLTDYLAANVEVGLGGPLVSFGATYKF